MSRKLLLVRLSKKLSDFDKIRQNHKNYFYLEIRKNISFNI